MHIGPRIQDPRQKKIGIATPVRAFCWNFDFLGAANTLHRNVERCDDTAF